MEESYLAETAALQIID